jgi:histone H3/H4
MLLPLASIDRLIRKAGAYRVSKEAAAELGSHLEEIAIEVAREAIILSEHAGRKTVRADDIKLAQKRMFD